MKYKVVLIVAALASVLAAGCGMIDSKKMDYKSTGKDRVSPLEIPPDLTQPGRDDKYSVPGATSKSSTTFSTYSNERANQGARANASSEVLLQVDKMRIERAGSQRWLVVTGMTPDKLWPALKEFWQDLGFIINIDLPESGIMETDWAEDRAKLPQDVIRGTIGKAFDFLYSTPERDKFRTRIEPGAEPDTVDIFISHRGMYETYINEGKTDTRWQPRPPDPELEAEMLRRLMMRLGADEEQAKAVTAETVSNDRARLLPDSAGGGLEMSEPFDRSWRRIGLALDRLGFTVEDRDRSQGIYFVRYIDPETGTGKSDEGFFSRLFSRSNKSDSGKMPKYRIHVKAVGDTSVAQVLTVEGGEDRSETGKKILRLLLDELK
jgi:outer membrane protein assembly factor BamC